MSFLEIVKLFFALVKFPSEVRALVLLLEKTPEEKRQAIMAKIQAESDRSAETGRPAPWPEDTL